MKAAELTTGTVFLDNMIYTTSQPIIHITLNCTQSLGYLISKEEVPVAFRLKGLRNVVLDLKGAAIMLHGQIIPFVLEDCENVVLRNFTIDCIMPCHLQANVMESDSEHMTVKIQKGFHYKVQDNQPIALLGEYEYPLNDGHVLIQPFDPITLSPAFDSGCMLACIGTPSRISKNPPFAVVNLTSKYLGDGAFIWSGQIPSGFKAGQVLTIPFAPRNTPGVYLCDCKDITLENIKMKRVAGFGVHAFFTENITVKRLDLSIGEDSNELISINADGIHCVGCSGRLLVEDCILENMLDDGGNIHGYFTPVTAVSGNSIAVSFDFPSGETLVWHKLYRPGDVLTIYKRKSIAVRGHVRVKDVVYVSDSLAMVLCDQSVDEMIMPGDHLEAHEKMPEIIIRRTRTGRNRPRGFLISTWRPTLIEDCFFNNSSVGIHFTGDFSYWQESGPVNNVIIRRNTFLNCGYSSADCSIAASPQFTPTTEAPYYHRGIQIYDNVFESFNDTTVSLNYCDNILYKNNVVKHSNVYPKRKHAKEVELNHCCNSIVLLEDR